jgi:hypothetical protein
MTSLDMRALVLIAVAAGSAAASPSLERLQGDHAKQSGNFLDGRAPLELIAQAPRNAQLVVWMTVYRDRGKVDARHCLYVVHRFASSEPVRVSLEFAWSANYRQHAYRIGIAGKKTEREWMLNPFRDLHAGIENAHFAGVSNAAFDTEYVLVERLWDHKQAGGPGELDELVLRHDAAVVIRAQFIAPREEQAHFDVEHCTV